jgi:hypothetical protein
MELLVINHGVRRCVPTKALKPGKEGNLQTLAELLPMIRRDAMDEGLRQFTLDLITDVASDFESQVGKVFEHARDAIRYVPDPLDAERIADAATTIAARAGDCGDKSELLAAMLGTVGYRSQLRALNFYNDLATHGYDHLLVRVQRDDGEWVSLDPTPEHATLGYEPSAPVVTDFEIWPNTAGGVGGVIDDLIGQGIQIGTQYVAGAVQQARVSAAQQQQLGAQFDNLAGQATALFNAIQSQPVITQADLDQAVAAYQQLAQAAQQFQSVTYIQQQWTSEDYKPAYEQRLREIAAAVATPTTTTTPGGVVQSLGLPASVSSLFSNPLALVAIALLGVAVLKK